MRKFIVTIAFCFLLLPSGAAAGDQTALPEEKEAIDWQLKALELQVEVETLKAQVQNLKQTINFYSQFISQLYKEKQIGASKNATERLQEYRKILKEGEDASGQ